ncbi:uncharacterized protein LOC124405196 [Diprion similis]|uniref:uncharacterized protein LOC124405196 n=1 Tax=Diprion similis TaxID=362088 RepID=UPI001EF87F1A|nr:uncharacterized protein LOC124405196 [Diprion similis]
MYVIAKISYMLLVAQSFLRVGCGGIPSFANPPASYKVNFPSRLYLPGRENLGEKNRVVGKERDQKVGASNDTDGVPENDMQVIPLAVYRDQQNGFQYQPIISRQFPQSFFEYPRHSQYAVPNGRRPFSRGPKSGRPIISVANEPKPITNSKLPQLFRIADDLGYGAESPDAEKLFLELTPPAVDGPGLPGIPDVRPVFEDSDNYDEDRNRPDYQLATGGVQSAFNQPVDPRPLFSGSARNVAECVGTKMEALLRDFDARYYNYRHRSHLDVPRNPTSSLILREHRAYYDQLAANNIHNNRPFGSYKLARDEEPRSFDRGGSLLNDRRVLESIFKDTKSYFTDIK